MRLPAGFKGNEGKLSRGRLNTVGLKKYCAKKLKERSPSLLKYGPPGHWVNIEKGKADCFGQG